MARKKVIARCAFCTKPVHMPTMMRHGTRHDLFGHVCPECHDERVKEGLKGSFVGCSKCNMPLAGQDILFVKSDVPGFFKVLCNACKMEFMDDAKAKGIDVTRHKVADL